MALLPEDIVRRSFRPSRFHRGYNEDDVDAFLNEVVEELEALHAAINDLRSGGNAEAVAVGEHADRLAFERAQLEQVKAERLSLIADLERLQERYDTLLRDIALVEGQASR